MPRGFAEFVQGFFVGGLRLVKPVTDILELLDKGTEFIVKHSALSGNLKYTFLLFLLAPDERHRAHRRQQGRRADEHNVPVEGVEENLLVLLYGKTECRFDGDEQDQVIRGVDLIELLIIFAAQLADMPAQAVQMFL